MTKPRDDVGTVAMIDAITQQARSLLGHPPMLNDLNAMLDIHFRETRIEPNDLAGTVATVEALPMQSFTAQSGRACIVQVETRVTISGRNDGAQGTITINAGRPIGVRVPLLWPIRESPESLRPVGIKIHRVGAGLPSYATGTRQHYAVSHAVTDYAKEILLPELTTNVWDAAFRRRHLMSIRARIVNANRELDELDTEVRELIGELSQPLDK